MSVKMRAAQFAPFSALTGYEEAVNETARLTEGKIELDESEKMQLDRRMQLIYKLLNGKAEELIGTFGEVEVTYFVKDKNKEGGAYKVLKGRVKKIDTFTHKLIMDNGEMIPIGEISGLNGEIFNVVDEFN
ncbi:MAG: hypothetical protein Q4F11_01150 [Eubacteriales bacterium]|nr:hypothetical protein [Eubacteriales bacterium]